jgi:hypothetical protein
MGSVMADPLKVMGGTSTPAGEVTVSVTVALEHRPFPQSKPFCHLA